jgi:hypothetical protein
LASIDRLVAVAIGGEGGVSAYPDQAQAREAQHSRHCNCAEFHVFLLLFISMDGWTADAGVGFITGQATK